MENLKFETFTAACISTAQITQEDNDLLIIHAGGYVIQGSLIVESYGYGFWVSLIENEDMEEGLEQFSPAFQNLFRLGLQKGWRYLQIDRDGPVVEGLPRFDW